MLILVELNFFLKSYWEINHLATIFLTVPNSKMVFLEYVIFLRKYRIITIFFFFKN